MSGIQPAGALIIGGLGHIGRGIVRALAGTGARLIVHDVAVEDPAGRDAAARGRKSDLRLPELAEQARAAGAATVDYALFDLADPHAPPPAAGRSSPSTGLTLSWRRRACSRQHRLPRCRVRCGTAFSP